MDHDPTTVTEVILPLLNVSRRDPDGSIDPTEPTQQQLYISSASNKGSYCYEKLIELFIQEIVLPQSTFVWGMDYRVPAAHGLLDKRFIEELKLSSTFQPDSFAREYLGYFTGGSADSWIDWDKLAKYRSIVNPEKRQLIRENEKSFYYISVDVARIGVLTSIQIFKVTEKPNYYLKKLVNSVGLHDMHFALQSIEIKKLIRDYRPKEVLIDGTGLGVGLIDFLVLDQFDDKTGELLPGVSSVNDEDYKQYPGEKLLYVLKANSTLNSKVHSNCYTQIINGHCRFLISEQEAKMKLIATKKGAKMSPARKMERLTPHIETTRLFEEICNLRIKQTGNDMVVERVSNNINKDRFSAFEYGLWRIKEMEEEYFKNKNRRNVDFSKLVLFTKGG